MLPKLPILRKRCPRCAVRTETTDRGYQRCPNCGWTDDPELSVPLEQPHGPEVSEE